MSSSKRVRSEDGDDAADGSPHKVSKGEDPSLRKATFKAYLKALNEQFSSWIQEQVSNHREELWSDGVRDYLDHADKILKDFQDVLTGAEKPAPSTTKSVTFGGTSTIGASPLFGAGGTDKPFGASSAATPSTEAPNKPAGGGLFGSTNPFMFGGGASSAASTSSSAPAASSPTKGSSGAAGTTAPAPANVFGFPAASSGAASSSASATSSGSIFGQPGGFSFGQPTTNPFGGVGGAFSFGGAAAANGAAPEPSSAGGQEEEEEAPQKYESEVVANDEAGAIMYKAKAKMSHYKRDSTPDGKPSGNWDSKGVGMVMLRAPKDAAAKPFVTFTTEAGRVLYIANIAKDMKMIVNDSANMLSWSAPWALTPDQKPSLQMVRFQLGKGKHSELKAEVEKLQGKMAD
uniref:RanBD1 domain-containing protein n=1 Tax=Dunaliella tertiolecta TaxID=3047 RepID=A0A7S3QWS9_DUNTE|mmetsp:Transcript_10043/g.27444  ORF Transcript_10043/g.27444 Transcript_10043/m.27444 type:complete len:403 (+) Transcript_10043:1040-2248(+)|eukprot:CAMPEP_0202401704 /NCGR_PEP_ID=MMETSP1128-20130828/3676_1 /ASSEMBLY_ACC=CAM_ASM_000463 /TAXON_ID=3047 /ORGANISM="Dunaliella tertiolecta, Strain CCMP1320" /LENGTH=402 /DNA_ID=CAMNT_0049005565 /DNA_START=987 /DNA_END=2195 /DNA_ORIENTATION=+